MSIYREACPVDDLKEYRQDAFAIFDSEIAGAIIGAIVAALVLYDIGQRIVERFFG